MITKSAVLFKIKSPLKIINLKIPELKKNQVLVKILYSGFCSSQYGEITGIKGKDNYLPHCLGHEACGIVIKKAKNIRNLKINDIVVCHWMKNHGKDCEKIEYKNILNGAKINSGQITTFNTLSIISCNRLTKVNNKKYKLEFLPLMGCSIPVAIATAEKILKIKKNKNILILGAGALGLPIVHFCKILKLKFIDVLDQNKEALNKARTFGAKRLFNSIEPEIVNSLNKNEYDYIVDTTGSSLLLNKIVSFNINCKIAFLGVPKKHEKLMINTLRINYGLKLLGSYGGNYNPEKDLFRYLNYLLKTKFPFKNYICKTYKLFEINQLVKDYKKGKIIGKALIKMH
jgi:Zn-dependent alcohol dehydrogenase